MSIQKDKEGAPGGDAQATRDDLGWAGKSAVHDLEKSVDLPGGVRLKDIPDAAPLPEFKPSDTRYEVVGLIGDLQPARTRECFEQRRDIIAKLPIANPALLQNVPGQNVKIKLRRDPQMSAVI